MKWGIRRFQNKDGTLTEAGKVHRKEIESDVKNKIESNSGSVNDIIASGKNLSDMANKLGDDYTKAFKSFRLSEKLKNKFFDELHSDFGDGVDDSEFFDLVLEEKIYKNLDSIIPNSVKNSRNNYEKAQNDYWEKVENFANDLVDKYKGTKVVDSNNGLSNGEDAVKNLLYKNLETSYPSYLYRHFDDYWVYDTPEFYSMVTQINKQINMNSYNKKYGS